ncbi:hypothetical protein M422DRAFT_189742 [Sphaerobolus stellatus SS14]|uniref:Uncharacterized protein n=1 Tax=Sphaerobolus stellatus (strain SS14) TaxID=990650 RepID=A0A0C9UT08_SPHS4|nr:hypothetical protein M422DRAFT_189742 [Sphaerobolus stellatus SS14]
MRQSPAQLRQVAIVDGQIGVIGAPKYPKFALFDTPLEDTYGENAPKLKTLKKIHNLENIMGLAGGFKL